MNIVQMILNLLSSSDVVSKIASALGISQEQVSKAISAAVPALLAALAGTASKPGGAADLANAAAKQDAGVLNNLSSLFSGGGAAAASQGSNLLGSLLGGGRCGPNRQRALALYRSKRDCHQQIARLPGAGRVGCN